MKIRVFRKAAGLSAEAFGELYGFPAQTVYGWEKRGTTAQPAAALKLHNLGICDLLDWSLPVEADEAARATANQ